MSNIDWSKLITKEMKEAAAAADQLVIDTSRETAWVTSEIAVVADQLMALEEFEAGSEDANPLPGTRTQWLQYRTKLRAWKTGSVGFPDMTKRPVRPQ
jgi:hypothetical protein